MFLNTHTAQKYSKERAVNLPTVILIGFFVWFIIISNNFDSFGDSSYHFILKIDKNNFSLWLKIGYCIVTMFKHSYFLNSLIYLLRYGFAQQCSSKHRDKINYCLNKQMKILVVATFQSLVSKLSVIVLQIVRYYFIFLSIIYAILLLLTITNWYAWRHMRTDVATNCRRNILLKLFSII